MSLVVLRQAFDWFDTSIEGRTRPHVADVLEEWKQLAIFEDCPQLAPMGGFDFALQPHGASPYAYLLRGQDMDISASSYNKRMGAFLHMGALGLAYYEPAALLEIALDIIEDYLGPNGVPKASRIDLCTDFQGFDPTGDHGGEFICRAKYKPILPSVDDPQTYQFGKGDLMARLYNKTKELKKSRKDWMHGLWSQHPDYDPSADVWRFELQLRRKTLRQLGVVTAYDALDKARELLRWGMGWVDLRIPQGKSTNRWPRHPAWEQLAEATGAHTVLQRDTSPAGLPDLEFIAQAVKGYCVSAGATMNDVDLERVMRILNDRVATKLDGNFEREVRKRQIKRIGKEAK